MSATGSTWKASALGLGAALLWALLCLRWFDVGEPWRPAWLSALPPALIAVPGLLLAVLWARSYWRALAVRAPLSMAAGLLLAVAAAGLFRLPLAWHGAVGYTTADAALSGIVALQARDGHAHHVFLPQLPYSGSLKSHLTAPLAAVLDPARAFTLASLAFYLLYVAGVHRLARLVTPDPRVALAAALYAAFAPAFVTHYGLSNDGNYVEVLALGTWALALAARFLTEPENRGRFGLVMGLLLGVAFWCHVLVVLHVAAIGLVLLWADRRAALRAVPGLTGGFLLGDLPGLLWNAGHGWESFLSLVPGLQPAGTDAHGPGLAERAWLTLTDHAPVLMGYDPGYSQPVDVALRVLGWLGVALAVLAVVRAGRDLVGRRPDALGLLLVFVAVDVVVAVLGLRYVPGNPRYLLFLMTPLPILLARELVPRRSWLLALLVAAGALGSLGQARGEFAEDARWRRFVAELEREGVRYCYTDFYLATRINFLSEQRVVCSAKLGPTRTEYFLELHERVDAAPEAAYVAVNGTQADKLARRLDRLGVRYERPSLMKPVLLRLSRKVDPQELFPEQSFGLR